MNRLLAADFVRLFKNKVFWFCMAFMFAFSALLYIDTYILDRQFGEKSAVDNGNFYAYAIFIGIVLAAFISLFVGTEYSNGTIRNKLATGHKRHEVYLANVIVCAVAGILMCLLYTLTSLIFGIFLMGFFENDAATILYRLLCIFFMCIAFSAIFTLTAMLNQSRSSVAVINILAVIVVLLFSISITTKLDEPEVWDSYSYVTEDGEIVTEPAQPNPSYVRGMTREIYIFLSDFLPTGQSIQLTAVQTPSKSSYILYSAIIAVAATGIGAALFSRKNIA